MAAQVLTRCHSVAGSGQASVCMLVAGAVGFHPRIDGVAGCLGGAACAARLAKQHRKHLKTPLFAVLWSCATGAGFPVVDVCAATISALAGRVRNAR